MFISRDKAITEEGKVESIGKKEAKDTKIC